MLSKTKVVKGKFYLYKGSIAKVLSRNVKENRVVLFRYDTMEREHVELDTISYSLTPLFKIGEVAKLLNRSTDTIRKYERWGLIDRPTTYKLKGELEIRFYTEQEIQELALFFATRKAVGTGQPTSFKIDRNIVNKYLKLRKNE